MIVPLWIMKCLMEESRRDIRRSWIISIMRKSEGQKIPEKEIVKQKFCKNFERGRILVRRARRCNREDLEQFQFAESAAQILRRDNQRIAFFQKPNNLHRKPAEIL